LLAFLLVRSALRGVWRAATGWTAASAALPPKAAHTRAHAAGHLAKMTLVRWGCAYRTLAGWVENRHDLGPPLHRPSDLDIRSNFGLGVHGPPPSKKFASPARTPFLHPAFLHPAKCRLTHTILTVRTAMGNAAVARFFAYLREGCTVRCARPPGGWPPRRRSRLRLRSAVAARTHAHVAGHLAKMTLVRWGGRVSYPRWLGRKSSRPWTAALPSARSRDLEQLWSRRARTPTLEKIRKSGQGPFPAPSFSAPSKVSLNPYRFNGPNRYGKRCRCSDFCLPARGVYSALRGVRRAALGGWLPRRRVRLRLRSAVAARVRTRTQPSILPR
jgi:hypothetical protein